MKVILASKNQHKLTELSAILSQLGFEIALESEYGLDIDVEETGTTFEENSFLKADAVMKASGLPVLADDSGLMVDALDGAPGVYSARYGHKASDKERTAYLLENMKDVPEERRGAKFVCVITCLFPDGRKIVARGECPRRHCPRAARGKRLRLRPGFLSSRAWHDVCRAAERTEKRNFPQSARSAGFLQKISRGTEP